MPRPRKIDYPTRFAWKQADKAWLRAHGGSLVVPLLIAVVCGVLSGNAVVLLVLIGVALAGAAWRRSQP